MKSGSVHHSAVLKGGRRIHHVRVARTIALIDLPQVGAPVPHLPVLKGGRRILLVPVARLIAVIGPLQVGGPVLLPAVPLPNVAFALKEATVLNALLVLIVRRIMRKGIQNGANVPHGNQPTIPGIADREKLPVTVPSVKSVLRPLRADLQQLPVGPTNPVGPTTMNPPVRPVRDAEDSHAPNPLFGNPARTMHLSLRATAPSV
ncbi:MAG: hypothetical protein RL021_1875 [Bacteroidota bacterium]|jgi:hypothetical protein